MACVRSRGVIGRQPPDRVEREYGPADGGREGASSVARARRHRQVVLQARLERVERGTTGMGREAGMSAPPAAGARLERGHGRACSPPTSPNGRLWLALAGTVGASGACTAAMARCGASSRWAARAACWLRVALARRASWRRLVAAIATAGAAATAIAAVSTDASVTGAGAVGAGGSSAWLAITCGASGSPGVASFSFSPPMNSATAATDAAGAPPPRPASHCDVPGDAARRVAPARPRWRQPRRH